MCTHKVFFKTISKSQNILINHYKHLHIRKILHIHFKNEIFLPFEKSKILSDCDIRGAEGISTGVEIKLPQLGPGVKLGETCDEYPWFHCLFL